MAEDFGRRGVFAPVNRQAECEVGIDRIEPTILQRVGADLVGQADTPTFLRQVQQNA